MSKIFIKYLVIFLHIIVIGCSLVPLLFTENLKVLGFLFFLVLLVFIQILVYDGCIMSKYERVTGDKYEFVPIEIIKKLLCINENIYLADLQKILVGFTLMIYLIKIVIILFVENIFEIPVNTFLNNSLIQVKNYL